MISIDNFLIDCLNGFIELKNSTKPSAVLPFGHSLLMKLINDGIDPFAIIFANKFGMILRCAFTSVTDLILDMCSKSSNGGSFDVTVKCLTFEIQWMNWLSEGSAFNRSFPKVNDAFSRQMSLIAASFECLNKN